jgi:hypothetical protein
MNTYKSVSKQTTLTPFRMNTYEKHRGEGVLLLTRNPEKDFYPEGALRLKDLSSFPIRESVLRSIPTIEDSDRVGRISLHIPRKISIPGETSRPRGPSQDPFHLRRFVGVLESV